MPASDSAWRSQILPLWKIAVPLAVAYFAEYMMLVVTKLIAGQLGYEALAAVGLASDLAFELAIIVMGFLSVTGVFIAQSVGAGDVTAAARNTRQALLLSTLLALPLMALIANLAPILLVLGQDPNVIAAAKPFLAWVCWFILPLLWFAVLRGFVSALSNAGIVMTISIAGIGVNYFLTKALVLGEYGLPRLELAGAGIAFSLSNALMALALALYVALSGRFSSYPIFSKLLQERPDFLTWSEISRLGLPVAALVAMEGGLFIAVSLLSGVIGVNELAAYQILMSWVGVPFVIALGIANATMVRVAWGIGQQNRLLARGAGIVGMASGVAIISLLTIVPISLPDTLVSLFLQKSDPGYVAVSTLVKQLLILVACFQVFDGLQSISSHALRGLKDTIAPLWIAGTGYWIIGIPGGSLLAFPLDFGVSGLWLGLAAGLMSTGSLLAARFFYKSRRLPAY